MFDNINGVNGVGQGGGDESPGIVDSRRGYGTIYTNSGELNPEYPTFFANPFRPSDAGKLAPLTQLMRFDADVSLVRRGFVSTTNPGTGVDDGGWGATNGDDNGNGVEDLAELDVSGGADIVAPRPLFFGDADQPYNNTDRNSYFAYMPLTRIQNLVTGRSNVYAIWITVGYFEVTQADDWATNENNVQQRFGFNTDPIAARAEYDRVYPEGYQLGQELGIETGRTVDTAAST